MNILVIVVVAVMYGLGSIIKAKGKKAQGQQGEKQLTRGPTHKPATGGRGVLEQFFNELRSLAEPTQGRESRPIGQPASQKIARPQPAVRKYAEAKQAGQVQLTTRPAEPEFTGKTVEGLAGKRMDRAAEVPESKYLSEVLLDFTDPDDLRIAILHYEILGRPLSLRDPSGQIIGLKL